MKIANLFLDLPELISQPADYLKKHAKQHRDLIQIQVTTQNSIHVVQRAKFKETFTEDDINYYFVPDESKSSLRWWQEPVNALELLASIEADVININGLNLPLCFRWLRRMVGENIKIIGTHTGEDIWAQRNLWIQQFGLRTADGFIFQKKTHAESWIRCAVILPRQPIFLLESYGSEESVSERLIQIYTTLIP
jgi:hypothetical protein